MSRKKKIIIGVVIFLVVVAAAAYYYWGIYLPKKNSAPGSSDQSGSTGNTSNQMSSSTAIGNALNNPGNIRKSSVTYKGEVNSSNPSFKQFADMSYGFRAMAELLYTYVTKHNLNTLSKIINTYAPAADKNNPTSYANFVSQNSGIGVNQPLDETDFDPSGGEPNMLKVIRWMARVEQGSMPDEGKLSAGYTLFAQDNGIV